MSQKFPFWAWQVDSPRKFGQVSQASRFVVHTCTFGIPLPSILFAAHVWSGCRRCSVKRCLLLYQPFLTKFGSVPGGHIFLTSTLIASLSYTLAPAYTYRYIGQIAHTLD
jgi:hypothetical protein